MIKAGVFVLSLAIFSSTLHIKMEHQAALAPGVATLKADTGAFLARCNYCGPMQSGGPDSATIHVNDQNAPYATWTVVPVGNQVALKADSGKYLTTCTNCWSGFSSDAGFVNGDSPTGTALWTPEKKQNGKWAFKGSNGKYLSRCRNCVGGGAYPDTAFVHLNDANQPYSQWTVEYKFPTGKVNLQADTDTFLSRCNGCGPANSADSADLHEKNPGEPWAIWTVQKFFNQVAFKGDNGKYLNKCSNCWRYGAYPDAAFVNADSASGSSLWTPEPLGNGKWALKGSNGKYLSRCLNCVYGGTSPNTAFVHLNDANQPYSQWTITTR